MTAPTFPSFYAECAFRDGQRDAARGTDSTAAYRRHGAEEPTGMAWYRAGFAAPQIAEASL